MLRMTTERPQTTSIPHTHATSELDFNQTEIFSPLEDDAGRILLGFEKAKLEWGCKIDAITVLRRMVLDGGDIIVIINGIKTEVTQPPLV